MSQSGKRTVRDAIEDKLSFAFAPQFLRVIDESHQHAGHAGHSGRADHHGETHFRVEMISENFVGKSRVERHRAVNNALAEEFAGGVHALALEISAPGEK
jgi:BolA family transcriptional regulator, general stress-responsive regulator